MICTASRENLGFESPSLVGVSREGVKLRVAVQHGQSESLCGQCKRWNATAADANALTSSWADRLYRAARYPFKIDGSINSLF